MTTPFDADALFQIHAGSATAGLTVAHDGCVVRMAPVLAKRFSGTSLAFVRKECKRLGWTLERVQKHAAHMTIDELLAVETM